MNNIQISEKQNNLKNNMYIYVSGIFLFYLVYIYLIYISQYTASDRMFYISFFEDPLSSRFEVGFVIIGRIFKFFHFTPLTSILILSSIIYFLAATTVILHFNNKPILALYFFILMFFGIASVFSFIQLRAGFAIWLSLLFYTKYKKTSKKKYILYMLSFSLFHTAVIFIALVAIALNIFGFKIRLLFILSAISSSIVVLFFDDLLLLLGIDPYYLSYFLDLNYNLRTSSIVLTFYIILVIGYFYRSRFNIDKYSISIIAIPLVFSAFFSYIDLIVKFAFPLIVLMWFGVTKAFFKTNINIDILNLLYLCLFAVMPLAVLYSALAVGVL